MKDHEYMKLILYHIEVNISMLGYSNSTTSRYNIQRPHKRW